MFACVRVRTVASGLTSFALMYITNRQTVNAAAEASEGTELRGLASHSGASDSSSDERGAGEAEDEPRREVKLSAGEREFTRHGTICLVRVLCATAICALENFHGLPVYLVVLIMGVVRARARARARTPQPPRPAAIAPVSPVCPTMKSRLREGVYVSRSDALFAALRTAWPSVWAGVLLI